MDSGIIESKVFKTWMEECGIIHTIAKPGATISLKEAKKNTEAVKKLSGEVRYPLLVDIRMIKMISQDARNHFAMKGREPMVNSIGIITGSMVSRLIGNIYLNFSRPVVPTRIFNNESTALKWLLQFTPESRQSLMQG